MNVVIRADASYAIGTGHVMRCLTLADALRQRGADVMFICREHTGNLIGFIESKGYSVVRLPQPDSGYVEMPGDVAHSSWMGVPWEQDASEIIVALKNTPAQWLIIDHYAIDRRWEEALYPYVSQIMVIDDLADRHHVCNVLLDQNFYKNMDQRYCILVPDYCRQFIGPYYALLREEFRKARRTLLKRDGIIRSLLVFFGGSDLTNETEKVLEALRTLDRQDIAVDVVVGASNPNKDHIRAICFDLPHVTFHCQVTNMAELMAHADIALGAGGSTTWERCFLKLPAIIWITAENQRETTEAVAHFGAIRNLGHYTQVTANNIFREISAAIVSPSELIAMGERGSELMGEPNGIDAIVNHLADNKKFAA